VAGLDEDLFGLGEIPALHCGLSLDSHLGIVELLLPLFQDINALVDGVDGNLWFEAEDALNIDLGADFIADFVRDRLKQVLHLILRLVDMSGDRPDQL
jgi:hypothetical protein